MEVLILRQFNKKIGLGSVSLLLCILGILFVFSFGGKGCYGDLILDFFRLKAWSNGNSGLHYTIFYSLLFFIPSVIFGFIFKNNLGASLGKIISLIMCILIILMSFLSAY